MATTVNIHEAKTHLSRLVELAEQGQETIIARAGKPAARLVPLVLETPGKRRLGLLEGQFTVPDDFDTMHQAEIEEMFYGNPDKFDR